jgi:formylglycine-generating enzyme required for sulfatase activity
MPDLLSGHVFMSYSRRDDAVMRRMVAFLRQQGINVWVDNEKLVPGTPVWEKEIEKAVQNASAVIVALSPDSKDSEWVRREINLADQHGKRVFPVLVHGDEKASISLRLIGRQYVDVRRDEEEGLKYVSASLLRYLEELDAQEQNAKKEAGRFTAQKARNERKLEKQKAEEERIAREKIETERKAKIEADRLAAQKVEDEKLTRQKAEDERIAREKAETERKAKIEADRLAAQKTDDEHIAREKAETERKAKIEADRLAAQKWEDNRLREIKLREAKENTDRLAAQQAEYEKLSKQKEIAEQKAKEEAERLAAQNFLPKLKIPALVFVVASISFISWQKFSSIPILPNPTPMPTISATSTATATGVPPTPTKILFGIGSTMSGKDGAPLVYVPEGEFTMGSDADDALAECQKYGTGCQRDWFTNEEPPHSVTLDAFWIDQTEVTNAMYVKCVSAGGCKEPTSAGSKTHPNYYGNPEFDNYPVIYVDWNMAGAYCAWAGRRLPTEAEWEKTARGTNTFTYPWGNTLDGTALNFCDSNCPYNWANRSFNDGYADVAPVGNYPSGQSAYGALDLAGNVWEWVNDWYDVYPGSETSIPVEFKQKYRILRGGSWYYSDANAQSTYRLSNVPDNTFDNVGFRCARDGK